MAVPLYYAACLCSLIYFRRDLENMPGPAIVFLFLGQFVFPIAGFAVCLRDILKRKLAGHWILLCLLLWPAQLVYLFKHGLHDRPVARPVGQPPPLPGAPTPFAKLGRIRMRPSHWLALGLVTAVAVLGITLSLCYPAPPDTVTMSGTSGRYTVEIPRFALASVKRNAGYELEFDVKICSFGFLYRKSPMGKAEILAAEQKAGQATYANASVQEEAPEHIGGRTWGAATIRGQQDGIPIEECVYAYAYGAEVIVIRASFYTTDGPSARKRLRDVLNSFQFVHLNQ